MSFKILGIEVSKQTNILAFSAFIMSFGSIVMQSMNLVQAPDVVLDGPEIVTLYVAKGGDDASYVRLLAGFTYLNMGTPGFDDFLKSESAVLNVDDVRIELNSLSYVATESQGLDLKRTFLGDATPVSLRSGDVSSHETEFMFYPKLKASDDPTRLGAFLSLIEGSQKLSVTFIAETYKGNVVRKTCHLKSKTVHWYLSSKVKTVDSKPAGWSANVCEASG